MFEGRGEDRKARIGNKVRKHIGNRGLISSSPRIMDDLFIDRHKSELRAGIYHYHRSGSLLCVEKQSDKVGGGGGQTFIVKDTFLDREGGYNNRWK